MRTLADYREIVGDDVVAHIYRQARALQGKHIVHLNSTYQGGGVAEMLVGIMPLLNDVGLDAGWRILHGRPDFFSITKKFHNALQGDAVNLTDIKKRLYLQANEEFSVYTHLHHDAVIIHDPQPLPLIQYFKKTQPWVWRCHVDLSDPHPGLWAFLKKFILRYDVVVISNENYRRPDLPVEQRVIFPAIDPLTPKNADLPARDIAKYLAKFGVPTDKPFITQISRFDTHKDPEGVIRVFSCLRQEADCRLVLCGSMAFDDPEGLAVYEKIERKYKKMIDAGDLILITAENDVLVNALQKTAAVVVQKSRKEGFGLTVTEALWKETPVVASRVGGIPLQVEDGVSGFLLEPNDENGFADRILRLLRDAEMRASFGRRGRETVKKMFLITRLVSDWLTLLNEFTL